MRRSLIKIIVEAVNRINWKSEIRSRKTSWKSVGITGVKQQIRLLAVETS